MLGCSTMSGEKDTARSLTREAKGALDDLFVANPSAKVLAEKAKGILVFPSIVKGGLLVGGQYGKGVLFEINKPNEYYSSVAASYGLQAGIQEFGYALIFMSDDDLKYLKNSDGWEVGVGPTITVVDVGMANAFTTTTSRKGVYAYFFSQKGLMAGLGIQGTKISRITP